MLPKIAVLLLAAGLSSGARAASTRQQHWDRLESVLAQVAPQNDRMLCQAVLAPVDEALLLNAEAALDEAASVAALTAREHGAIADGYRRLVVRHADRLRMLADLHPAILHFVFLLAAPDEQWNRARVEFRRLYGFTPPVGPVRVFLNRILALKRKAIDQLESQYQAEYAQKPRPRRLRDTGRALGDQRASLPDVLYLKQRSDLLH